MLKLHHRGLRRYWEHWHDADDRAVLHWGDWGTRGRQRTIENGARSAASVLADEAQYMRSLGYAEMPPQDHVWLKIEYPLGETPEADHDINDDLTKRHALEAWLDELLGWTGLGHCDGGDIGMGSMAVYALVVDGALACDVVAKALVDTEYAAGARLFVKPNDQDGEWIEPEN